MTPETYHAFIDRIFDVCVQLLVDLAAATGTTYEVVNVWLFIVIQPGLILLFAALWLAAERRGAGLRRRLAATRDGGRPDARRATRP